MAQFSRTTSQIDAILDDVVSAKGESASLTAEVASKTTIEGAIEGVYGIGTAIALDSDLDDITTAGAYYSDSQNTSASLSNCPHAASGFQLFVTLPYGVNVHQILYPISAGGNGSFYKRVKTPDGWQAWAKFTSYGLGTKIAVSTDLDTLSQPGVYYWSPANAQQTVTNSPTQKIFVMTVKCTNGSTRYLQEITTAPVDGEIIVYKRAYTQQGWKSWYKFEGTVVS